MTAGQRACTAQVPRRPDPTALNPTATDWEHDPLLLGDPPDRSLCPNSARAIRQPHRVTNGARCEDVPNQRRRQVYWPKRRAATDVRIDTSIMTRAIQQMTAEDQW